MSDSDDSAPTNDSAGSYWDDPNNYNRGPQAGYVRVWFDDQNFMDYDQSEADGLYIDNSIVNFAIQPDVWTLDIDPAPLNLWYSGGHEYQIPHLGDIQEQWDPPARLSMAGNGLIVPVDDSFRPLYNATTTPRLRFLRWELHRRIQELAQERLELAQLVNAFAEILQQYSSLDGTATTAFKGPLGT